MTNVPSPNWARFALGLAMRDLEANFLFAYRSGWEISLPALAVDSSVSIILYPPGHAYFREALIPANLLGV